MRGGNQLRLGVQLVVEHGEYRPRQPEMQAIVYLVHDQYASEAKRLDDMPRQRSKLLRASGVMEQARNADASVHRFKVEQVGHPRVVAECLLAGAVFITRTLWMRVGDGFGRIVEIVKIEIRLLHELGHEMPHVSSFFQHVKRHPNWYVVHVNHVD